MRSSRGRGTRLEPSGPAQTSAGKWEVSGGGGGVGGARVRRGSVAWVWVIWPWVWGGLWGVTPWDGLRGMSKPAPELASAAPAAFPPSKGDHLRRNRDGDCRAGCSVFTVAAGGGGGTMRGAGAPVALTALGCPLCHGEVTSKAEDADIGESR